MSFLNPAALWAFSLLVPLVAIYFLKVRPEKQFTSTLFLWEKVFQEKQTSALFRRLRDLFSLLLLLLAFSAVILAMARPILTSKKSKNNLVLIIDISPSMKAVNKNGTSRLKQAKQTAENIVANMSSNQKATIATANDLLHVVINSTSNKKMLLEGIANIKSSAIPLAVDSLQSLIHDDRFLSKTRFIFLSDGCAENSTSIPSSIELLKIGKPLKNIGITAFDLRSIPGSTPTLGLYFQLASSYNKSIDIDVILSHEDNDNIVKVCPVKVAPGINAPELFTINTALSGKWLLYIDHHDALAIDNSAFGVLPQQQPIEISIGNPVNSSFYQHCIAAFKNSSNQLRFNTENPEIIINEGSNRHHKGVDNYIFLNPTGKSPFWQITGSSLPGTIANIRLNKHNAIKFAPIEGLLFEGAKELKAPASSTILADNGHGIPLIYKAKYKNQHAYVINIDPSKSDFFLSINFPILLYSMALDLANRSQHYVITHKPGDQLRLPSITNAKKVTVTLPDKQQEADPPGMAIRLTTPGFYKFSSPPATSAIACSLLSRADSLLNTDKVTQTAKPLEKGIPISTILLILAIILIATECILYHRRKVG